MSPPLTLRATRRSLAHEPDITLGALQARPSLCRVVTGGQEVRVEALTMSLLVTLARAQGATTTREQLIEACWQGRYVSDDAIARGIAKVRALAKLASPAPFVLETVPKVGYRLWVPDAGQPANAVAAEVTLPASAPGTAPGPAALRRKWLPAALVAGVFAVVAIVGAASRHWPPPPQTSPPTIAEGPVRVADFVDALMHLDEQRIALFLDRGWKPAWHLDTEGSSALTYLMLVCERNPTHDQAGLLSVAKQLVAAGADPDYRNKWGDSALIIARSPKYCGPRHPVVGYLQSIAPASALRIPDEADPG